MLSRLLHIPTFPFLCPPAQCVSSWRWVKGCQGTMRAWVAVFSPQKRSPSTEFCPSAKHLPPLGVETLYTALEDISLQTSTKKGLERVLWGVEISHHCVTSHWEHICLLGSWKGSNLVPQCPSYHEFITAVQYQLLWYIWRVPAVAIVFSGVPLGWMLGPLKFLFPPLWIEGASAAKLGPFVVCAFLISCRATVYAVGSGSLRCIQGLGLGLGWTWS